MNLSNYKCLGFSSFTIEKYLQYLSSHKKDLSLLKATKNDIHYYSLHLCHSDGFFLDLLLEMRCDNKHSQLIDFVPVAYTTEKPPIVCEPQWIKKSFFNGIMSLSYKEVGVSFHMQVPTTVLMPKVSQKKQYYSTAICFARQIQTFSSEAAFRERKAIYDVESIAHPQTLRERRYPNELIINGFLHSVKKRLNPITEETFYFFFVESMGCFFPVLAASSDFEKPPVEGEIVSVFGLMNGFLGAEASGKVLERTYNAPIEKQMFDLTVKHILANLRDKSYEALVVNIPKMNLGHLQYVQAIREGSKYVVEISLARSGEISLFRSGKKNLAQATRIFETILVENLIPDMSSWRDISKIF